MLPCAVSRCCVSQPLDKPACLVATNWCGKFWRQSSACVASTSRCCCKSLVSLRHTLSKHIQRPQILSLRVGIFFIDPKFTELEFAKVYWVYLKTVREAIALNKLINKVFKISFVFNLFSIAYFINCHLQFTLQFNHTAISSLFQFVSRCKDDTQIVPGAAATSIDTDNWDTTRVLFGAAIRI